MTNLISYVQKMLTDCTELKTLLGKNKIVSAYPDEVKIFPLVIHEELNQRDVAFSDNLPNGSAGSVRVHIFTKILTGLPTTWDVAKIVCNLFRSDFWTCTNNQEMTEGNGIKHRILDFTKEFYSL